MKAVVYTTYGPPEVLRLKEVEKPAPKDNEVLIRIHASTVTAVDCTFRQGKPFIGRLFNGLMKPKNPVPGTEFAGNIETAGKYVTQFKTGDRVYGTTLNSGAYAEYITLPEEGGTLAVMPSNMTYEEAVGCDGFLTALPFLRETGKIISGQNVLIYGASGSVGSAAVQLASFFGAEVTGVCSTANVELVKSLGADKVIDYTGEDFTRNGERYDIIFDAVGKTSFSKCRRSLKDGGIFLEAALTPGILPLMMWTSKFGTKKAMITFTGLRPPHERTKDLQFISELAENGTIRPVIDRTYTLDQIAEAHRYVETGHKKGNVIITVKHESTEHP